MIRCKNPRCITSIEQELDHVFVLTDEENRDLPLQILRREISATIINKKNKETALSKTISRVMSLDDHLSRPDVAVRLKRPT